jgi:hypothetical protein
MVMSVADGTTTSYEPFTIDDETMHFRSATPAMHHFGGTASLAAQRRKESIRASSPGATIHGLSLLSQARRAQWEANGNEVLSCEEYAYEGQYNWSKYEDQVAALLTRCAAAGLDFIKTEGLFTFDGQRGYSAGGE